MYDYLRIQYLRYVTLSAYRSGDWRKIPIQDNGQKLAQIPEDIAFPFYARVMNLVTDERMFLREEVLEKVLLARDETRRLGLVLLFMTVGALLNCKRISSGFI